MEEREIIVQTSQGELKAVTSLMDDNYPGIKVYLGNELFACIEMYEEDGILRAHLYDDENQEPIVSKTLLDTNNK